MAPRGQVYRYVILPVELQYLLPHQTSLRATSASAGIHGYQGPLYYTGVHSTSWGADLWLLESLLPPFPRG